MPTYKAVQPGRSVKSRRCARCSHLNPAAYLVCRECRAVLSHSDWVDLPAIQLEHLPELPEDDDATRDLRTGLPALNADAPQRLPFFEKRDTTPFRAFVDDAAGSDAAQDSPAGEKAKTEPIVERPLPAKETPSIRETLTIPAISLDFSTLDEALDGIEALDGMGGAVRTGRFVDGTSVFDASMLLCITIEAGRTPLVLRLPQQRALVFGRDDPETKERPDIDLIPYGGYNMGISRRHAALELVGKRLSIRDLRSSNGTFLNDVRLDAYEPHQLRDGDTVRLGNLSLSVAFCK